MTDYPTHDEVLDGLGDKMVGDLSACIAAAERDLQEYRRLAPQFVARHSPRGLANWIHDQLWAHLKAALDGRNGVVLIDNGTTREIHLGFDYRIRIKRHSLAGAVSAYPTQTTLDFITQEPDLLALLGIRQINLCVGYGWDRLTRSMTGPVISLRDGSFDEVIWMADLPAAPEAGDGTVTRITPPAAGPTQPVIETPNIDDDEEGAELE